MFACIRLRLLKQLIDDCPYHNVVGLLIDRAQREIQKLWQITGTIPDDIFTPDYVVSYITTRVQTITTISYADMAMRLDEFTATLSLLRFLLLKDKVKDC